MIFAAIDPGSVNAAIAVFNGGSPLHVQDLRVVNNMIDGTALASMLTHSRVEHVVVENVHSMPKQGVASTFRFGMACGIIRGVVGALKLPLTLVTPTQWKSFHSLAGPDKEASRQLAIHRWPYLADHLDRKKDADRAEALLIGDWFYVRRVIARTPEAVT